MAYAIVQCTARLTLCAVVQFVCVLESQDSGKVIIGAQLCMMFYFCARLTTAITAMHADTSNRSQDNGLCNSIDYGLRLLIKLKFLSSAKHLGQW